jgi:hypothetical protein
VPTSIGPRVPRRGPSRADTASQGVFWQRLAGIVGLARTDEQRDQAIAERTMRLAAWLRGEPVEGVWELDVKPLLLDAYDATLARVKDPDRSLRADPDALLALELFAHSIDGTLSLGAGAMERLAARRLKGVVAAEASKEEATKSA